MVAHLSFSHILIMLIITVFCAFTGEFVIHRCSLSTVFRNAGGLDGTLSDPQFMWPTSSHVLV